jgi:predicted PurR-regulated permease PerM
MPPLALQVADLVSNFASLRAKVMRGVPADNMLLHTVVEQMLLLPSSPAVVAELNKPLVWGRAAVVGLMTTFLVLMATLYLLLDGKRLYAWLLAYVPRAQREKMGRTIPEVSRVVHAYIGGQCITSSFFAIFVAIALSLLKVPAVLPLALLAGACDVIPVVGIIIATAPAALLALTVAPSTAALVVVIYVVYHLFESYFLVPRVYGTTLRLSALAVLLALIVGSTLQGLIGAVLVLPLVAAYPIIERIWLAEYLGRDVLADHQALASALDTGGETAVNAVLQGERHSSETKL